MIAETTQTSPIQSHSQRIARKHLIKQLRGLSGFDKKNLDPKKVG